MANYLELFKEATQIFKDKYPDSIMFTAIGKPASGEAKTADDLTNWQFRATAGGKTAVLEYSNGQFGEPTMSGSWIGLMFKQLPQGTLKLPETIKILNENGYESFSNVAFGTPSTENPQPMNWFCSGGYQQGVSASTGDFFPDLFPCAPGGAVGQEEEE